MLRRVLRVLIAINLFVILASSPSRTQAHPLIDQPGVFAITAPMLGIVVGLIVTSLIKKPEPEVEPKSKLDLKTLESLEIAETKITRPELRDISPHPLQLCIRCPQP